MTRWILVGAAAGVSIVAAAVAWMNLTDWPHEQYERWD